ncbi:MAG: hypothetical protein LBR32_10335 [Propionibacteriaceae bacterium]|jgi:hypothetical protein|nr:hypothetical protein [Propionibacteriaceae bacterium]
MDQISAEVLAVAVAMVDGLPNVLTLGQPPALPAGPLLPSHRSLQAATRAWVEEQAGRRLGYLEQLYTFADLGRGPETSGRRISVSYLGLTTPGRPGDTATAPPFGALPDPAAVPSGSGGPTAPGVGSADDGATAGSLGEPPAPASRPASASGGVWTPWYELFPWEDTREFDLDAFIAPALRAWAGDDNGRRQRVEIAFGRTGSGWQPDLVLSRYELLYEAGLIPESPPGLRQARLVGGWRMFGDHRRVLATGMARLRAKIEYRPVVFELLPTTFTLRQLQDCVEALAGRGVHTQNFRRLVDQQSLVEETGQLADTGGRPARLYRFRREILQERHVAGTKLPTTRAK